MLVLLPTKDRYELNEVLPVELAQSVPAVLGLQWIALRTSRGS
jgi:hypothetical protein